MEREKIGSRLGFILLSAGCAIGCGNVWKFPWMVGQNGGGAFVLIYMAFLIVLGLPAMTIEFAMGRAAQASPVRIYHKLTPDKKGWRAHGYLSLLGNVCLMAFYTTVTGWMIYYCVSFISGNTDSLGFNQMISDPVINVTYLFIAIAAGFFVLTFKLQNGLERVTKYMLSALLILMLILAVRSGFFDGAAEGYRFYLMPDFTAITPNVVVAAMNQAFFTLSVGIGSMAIFGSYIDKNRSLMGESLNILLLDTFVAIVSGLIIFPACYAFDVEVTSGPSLLFDTMSKVFLNMSGGRIWGSCFFVFMVFAAFSTELAVCENILACVRELTGWSRRKGSAICGISIFLVSLTTALGFSVLKFKPFGDESSWLDMWDFIVSMNLLPIGALCISAYVISSRYGWGWESFTAEANTGKGLRVKDWMKPVFKYVLPLGILVVYILGLVNFKFK